MTNADDLITPLINTDTEVGHYSGLTKREYFAAMAMQGLCAGQSENYQFTDNNRLVQEAVNISNALITELNKQPC